MLEPAMFRNFVSAIIVLILCLITVHDASAHPNQPRLEISVERVNPGGILDVRGVAFDYEEHVKLYLERKGIVIQLGELNADLEGTFIYTAVLPVDLPQGEYSIRAVTGHHDILSPALTVQGTPIMESGGQGERDEDDGLLAPMPTFAPGVSSTALPQPTAVAQPVPEQIPVSKLSPMLLLGLSIVLVLTGFFVFRRRALAKE